MKVTNELNSKITRCINEKYRDEIEVLNNDIKQLKEEAVNKLTEELNKAIEVCPVLNTILPRVNSIYQSEDKIRLVAETWVFNRTGYIKIDEIDEIEKKLKEISDKKSMEIENIRIKISYGKSFEDIKSVFDEYGVKF